MTQTPITASNGLITYFAVTTTNAATAGHRIEFSVRLCENPGIACNVPPFGITIARCSPWPGSKTCSWVAAKGKELPFHTWKPSFLDNPCPSGSGNCHSKDPAMLDRGLIDIAVRCLKPSGGHKKCDAKGTYDPGHVSWSVAYIKP